MLHPGISLELTYPSISCPSSVESMGRNGIEIHPSGFANSQKRTYPRTNKLFHPDAFIAYSPSLPCPSLVAEE